jgi:acetolactate synthase regulatory subunit
MRGFRF